MNSHSTQNKNPKALRCLSRHYSVHLPCYFFMTCFHILTLTILTTLTFLLFLGTCHAGHLHWFCLLESSSDICMANTLTCFKSFLKCHLLREAWISLLKITSIIPQHILPIFLGVCLHSTLNTRSRTQIHICIHLQK